MSDARYLPVKQVRDEPAPVVSTDAPVKNKAFKMVALSNEGQTVQNVQGKFLPKKSIFKS